ncbi:hypothetical protein F5884DRAFT_884584 [Xylogone sp. PMI_703]|nr:hypothetical protein F5884DRAFT_884584 [Xylogone sp. PMI_703]
MNSVDAQGLVDEALLLRARKFLKDVQFHEIDGIPVFKTFFHAFNLWKTRPPTTDAERQQVHQLLSTQRTLSPHEATALLPALIPSPDVLEARTKAYQLACEKQSRARCRLLRLPLEIREKIWAETLVGGVVHVCRKDRSLSSDTDPDYVARPSEFSHTYCRCASPLGSSSAPAGKSDHVNCRPSSSSSFASIRLVCKQIYMELPRDDVNDLLYARNALQFDDVQSAFDYLFSIRENRRCAVTHLRFSLPRSFMTDVVLPQEDQEVIEKLGGVFNYYGLPWDRETLGIGHDLYKYDFNVSPWLRPYFYYSDCYLSHNAHRMGKRWQFGVGGVSWDMGISSLIYKGMPKMDIGVEYIPISPGKENLQQPSFSKKRKRGEPNSKNNATETKDNDTPSPSHLYIHPSLVSAPGLTSPTWVCGQLLLRCAWVRPFLKFRQYKDLDFHFYSDSDLKDSSPLSPSPSPPPSSLLPSQPGRLPSPPPEFKNFVFWLKEVLADPVVGPRGQPVFEDHSDNPGNYYSW